MLIRLDARRMIVANIKHVVELTLDERAALKAKIGKGVLGAKANLSTPE